MGKKNKELDIFVKLVEVLNNMPIQIPECYKTQAEKDAYKSGAISRDIELGNRIFYLMDKYIIKKEK